ncbi:MAG: transglycosylase SLT domain-containing protein [Opitutales bacterium]
MLIVAALSLLILLARPWMADPVPPEQAWQKATALGLQSGIDPLLIFAIACAESSLDGHASSARARGLMQLSPAAWESVSKRPFREAWKWQRNMEESVNYLKQIKDRQQTAGHYSWPALAAAYRYGPNAVQQVDYDLSRLPRSTNIIYKDLLAGKTPKLPFPATARPIMSDWPPPAPKAPLQKPAETLPEPVAQPPEPAIPQAEPTIPAPPPALTDNQLMLK